MTCSETWHEESPELQAAGSAQDSLLGIFGFQINWKKPPVLSEEKIPDSLEQIFAFGTAQAQLSPKPLLKQTLLLGFRVTSAG